MFWEAKPRVPRDMAAARAADVDEAAAGTYLLRGEGAGDRSPATELVDRECLGIGRFTSKAFASAFSCVRTK